MIKHTYTHSLTHTHTRSMVHEETGIKSKALKKLMKPIGFSLCANK